MTSVLLFGLLIGMQHALEADHVAAVSSLCMGTRSARGIATHGAIWGLGHSLTLLIFAGAVVFWNLRFDETLAQVLECVVGVMLIVLGGQVLFRLWRNRLLFPAYWRTDGRPPFHVHSHPGEKTGHESNRYVHTHASRLPLRTLLVGMVHGLAGSAALMILTASTVQNPVIGLLNETLRSVGLDSLTRPWLGSRHNALPAIAVAMIWQGLGTYVILFLAGLQKIPLSFYESAELDGANAWQQFWHVTLPLLWDVVQILVIFWIIGAFQAFALIFVITRGYPNVIEVLGTYIYWAGFQGQSIGYASAMGVVMFFFVLAFSLVVHRLTRRERVEY